MPIYKIKGDNGYGRETRELYVHASTEDEAQRFAMKRGVMKGVSEPVLPQDVPEGVPVLRATASGRSDDRPALETHPVRTIALGVMLGLVGFTVLMWAFAFLLSALGIALFGTG